MYRVELKDFPFKSSKNFSSKFLMYRVELKDIFCFRLSLLRCYIVPNVPCGVERKSIPNLRKLSSVFLMYRVELKDLWCGSGLGGLDGLLFLMYRVELKGTFEGKVGVVGVCS